MKSTASAEMGAKKLWRIEGSKKHPETTAENGAEISRFSSANTAGTHALNCYNFEKFASLSRKLLALYYHHY